MDYRKMFDPPKYLAAFVLEGKDITVTIDKVVAETIEGEAGRKDKRPVVYFKGASLPLVLNKTNGKTLQKLYGADTDKWSGKGVTLYATTCKNKGDIVDCIRMKPPQDKQ